MRYRVSMVEAFRHWEQDDEADTDRLIASICGLGDETPAMRAGTALHKALELAEPGEVDTLTVPGYVFRFPRDYTLALAPIREMRASRVYMADGEPICISGQVDALDGLRIEDHKSTSRFDADRYLAGYQWRLYLSIFGASMFRWNVFEMSEVEEPEPYVGTNTAERLERVEDVFALGPVCYEVTAVHRLEQYRYPTLEADCQALVTRFARFVRERIEVPA